MRHLALSLSAATLIASCGGEDVLPPPTTQVQGSLRITWSVQDGAGAPKTCAEVFLERVELQVGGRPSTHECGLGVIQIDHLLPDRYPIVAKAIGSSGGTRVQVLENGVVVAGSTTTVPLTFVVDAAAGLKGDLSVRWRIDGREPRTECAVAGADFARVIGGAGSIERFEELVPCTQAEITLRDLKAGVYVPEVRLETADGTRLAVGVGDAARVQADMLTEAPFVNVFSSPGRPTRLRAFWTVNSSAAPGACDTVRGRQVTFATVPRPPAVASSTTVNCARGGAELRSGVGVGSNTVRLTLEHGIASTTSTTVRDVMARRGETSTVTVDFDTRE